MQRHILSHPGIRREFSEISTAEEMLEIFGDSEEEEEDEEEDEDDDNDSQDNENDYEYYHYEKDTRITPTMINGEWTHQERFELVNTLKVILKKLCRSGSKKFKCNIQLDFMLSDE
jgi:hypothetical protein